MANVPNIAQTLKSTDLVSVELLVDGNPLSDVYQVIMLNIRQEINKIPAATIVIFDGEPNIEDFTISSSNDFKPGKKVEIKLGYQGH